MTAAPDDDDAVAVSSQQPSSPRVTIRVRTVLPENQIANCYAMDFKPGYFLKRFSLWMHLERVRISAAAGNVAHSACMSNRFDSCKTSNKAALGKGTFMKQL